MWMDGGEALGLASGVVSALGSSTPQCATMRYLAGVHYLHSITLDLGRNKTPC